MDPIATARFRIVSRNGVLAFAMAAAIAAPSSALAKTLHVSMQIGDGSNPPSHAGALWKLYCYFEAPQPTTPPGTDWWPMGQGGGSPGMWLFSPPKWIKKCGENLPALTTVTVETGTDSELIRVEGVFTATSVMNPHYSFGSHFSGPGGCQTVPPYECYGWLELNAVRGSVHGYVRLPDGTALANAAVGAFNFTGTVPPGSSPPQPVKVVYTDNEGHYDFTMPDDPPVLYDQNNWGLYLEPFHHPYYPGPSGDSQYTIVVGAVGQPTVGYVPASSISANSKVAGVGSSQRTQVDFYVAEIEETESPDEPGGDEDDDENSEEDSEPEEDNPECDPEVGDCKEKSCNPGEPISLVSGSVYFRERDIVLAGPRRSFPLSRSYRSGRALKGAVGVFGRGWQHSYEKEVVELGPKLIRLSPGNGAAVYFTDTDGDQTYRAAMPASHRSWLVKNGSGWVRHFKQGGSETYDASGRLVSQLDRVGNATSLAYADGRLTSIQFPGSRSLSFGYTGDFVTSVLGPEGVVAEYKYTSTGMLSEVGYPDGSGQKFDYDDDGQVLGVSDKLGTVRETHTYLGGRALTSELGGGTEKYTVAMALGANGSVSGSYSDSNGNVTSFLGARIGGVRRVTRKQGGCPSCCGGSVDQEWTYTPEGRIESYRNGSAALKSFGYDAAGNLNSWAVGSLQTTYTHDGFGRVVSKTAPGHNKTWTYGAAGATSIRLGTEEPTTIDYNPNGTIQRIINPRGKAISFGYNTAGDVTSVTNAVNKTTVLGRNGMGRLTSITDSLNHTTGLDYDVRGRLKKVTYHDQSHADFEYDQAGRRTVSKDPLGRETKYTYDDHGRLTVIEDALGGVTRYDYDAMSNLAAITDAKDQRTQFDHDGCGRLTKTTYPGGAFETLGYDAEGRLRSKVDRKNVTTTLDYDGFGRLTGKTYSDTTPPVTYSYDAVTGRITSAANGTDTLSWTYDPVGRIASESSSRNGSTVEYSYDDEGNRTELKLDGSLFLAYEYDDASRLSEITRGASVFGFGYDEAGRRSSMTYPNGVVTSYDYDDLSGLTRLKALLGTTTITDTSYAHDPVGNRTSKTTPDLTEVYDYDGLYRLTDVERVIGPAGRWLYGYDAVGNRTMSQLGESIVTASYNEMNQLISTEGGGTILWRGTLNEAGNVTYTSATINDQPARMLPGNVFEATIPVAAGANPVELRATDASGNVRTSTYSLQVASSGASYTYDPNGNLTQKAEGATTWTDEWNATNQLTRVLNNGIEVARYSYDPLGRRVEKVAGGITTSYVYDGVDILRENKGGTIATYIHGPQIDEPLAKVSEGELTYVHADGLRSIVTVTDQSGTITSTIRYDAWGNLEAGTPSLHAYTGREWDGETGLYYYRSRYYDPKVGRFLSEDPIGLLGGDINVSVFLGGDINLYAYVSNNLINSTDAFGLAIDDSIRAQIRNGRADQLKAIVDTLPKQDQPIVRAAIEKFESKAADYIAKNLKGSVNAEFPTELRNKTLQQIWELARSGDKAAQTARKLLSDTRFCK